MTPERSRQLGFALIVVSALQLLLFLFGAVRRSYTALAIPVFAGVAVVSGLGFWIGYTMATAEWDDYVEEVTPAPPSPSEAPTPS